MDVSVCVVGAGIIGLSTAVSISQLALPGYRVHVTIISEQFSPETTADGSAGFWEPYLSAETPLEKIKQWGTATFQHSLPLVNSDDDIFPGISFLSATEFLELDPGQTLHDITPWWKDTVFNFKFMTSADMKRFSHVPSITKNYVGWTFTTLSTDVTQYMKWLLNKFLSNGGTIKKRRINSFAELAGAYDVIVNCTGMQSRELCNDLEVVPVKGQVIKVKAPWIKHFTALNDVGSWPIYIIPRGDHVVLGGTKEPGNFELSVNQADRERVWKGCLELEPTLKHARVIRDWVGLRPSRRCIRLEKETLQTSAGPVKVVHNYGHGGSGVTLAWGCALEATELVTDFLQTLKPTSKL